MIFYTQMPRTPAAPRTATHTTVTALCIHSHR
nr:MAG TPA: hypothetical protein [Caudoviricetes sp.]